MAYYLRVFCASRECPTVAGVVESAAAEGVLLRPEGAHALGESSSSTVALNYAPDRPPLILELDRDTASVKDEVDEFVEAVASLPSSHAKERVLVGLQATTMVAAIQISTSDADDATYDAAGALVRYFADNRHGLIQADSEGFYEGTELILPLD